MVNISKGKNLDIPDLKEKSGITKDADKASEFAKESARIRIQKAKEEKKKEEQSKPIFDDAIPKKTDSNLDDRLVSSSYMIKYKVKKKITELVKENNYKSASALVNYLLERDLFK